MNPIGNRNLDHEIVFIRGSVKERWHGAKTEKAILAKIKRDRTNVGWIDTSNNGNYFQLGISHDNKLEVGNRSISIRKEEILDNPAGVLGSMKKKREEG